MKYAFAILVIACAVAAANADVSAACQKCFDDTMAKRCPNEHDCPKGIKKGAMQTCGTSGDCTPADLIEDGCMEKQMKATLTQFEGCVEQETDQCEDCDQGAW